jgi:hypothetical protein
MAAWIRISACHWGFFPTSAASPSPTGSSDTVHRPKKLSFPFSYPEGRHDIHPHHVTHA